MYVEPVLELLSATGVPELIVYVAVVVPASCSAATSVSWRFRYKKYSQLTLTDNSNSKNCASHNTSYVAVIGCDGG